MVNLTGGNQKNVSPMKSLKDMYKGKKDTSISSKEFGSKVPKIGISP